MGKVIKMVSKADIHESMDRISIINHNIEDFVVKSRAVFYNAKHKKMAEKAILTLSKLYQKLGNE